MRDDQKLTGFTILVVEDNELNQRVVKAILEYSGATVATCRAGEEALNLLNEELF